MTDGSLFEEPNEGDDATEGPTGLQSPPQRQAGPPRGPRAQGEGVRIITAEEVAETASRREAAERQAAGSPRPAERPLPLRRATPPPASRCRSPADPRTCSGRAPWQRTLPVAPLRRRVPSDPVVSPRLQRHSLRRTSARVVVPPSRWTQATTQQHR